MASDQFRAEDGDHPVPRAFREMLTWAFRLAREDSGEDLVEYALLTAFIGLAGAAVFGVMITALNSGYSSWDSTTQGLWEMPPPQ